MARIRSVHPSLFTDEAWVSCSPLARVLFIGLETDADDQGVFEWKALQIKMRLLPGDTADVPALLCELEAAGLIKPFEVEGRKFGAIRNFRKHQRPQKPTAQHPLPDDMAKYVGLGGETTRPVAEASDSPTVIADQMEDGEGEEEEKEEEQEASPLVDATSFVTLAVAYWNEMATANGLPEAKAVGDPRRKAIGARLKEAGLDGWKAAVDAVEVSKWCRGLKPDSSWRASIDFVARPGKFQGLIEGAFGQDATPGRKVVTKPVSPEEVWRRRLRGLEQAGVWKETEWGPRPPSVHSRCPASILAEFGLAPDPVINLDARRTGAAA